MSWDNIDEYIEKKRKFESKKSSPVTKGTETKNQTNTEKKEKQVIIVCPKCKSKDISKPFSLIDKLMCNSCGYHSYEVNFND